MFLCFSARLRDTSCLYRKNIEFYAEGYDEMMIFQQGYCRVNGNHTRVAISQSWQCLVQILQALLSRHRAQRCLIGFSF